MCGATEKKRRRDLYSSPLHVRLIDETVKSELTLSESRKAPLAGPPKFGGLPSRRLGGCTIVQVENELEGKLIPGSSRKAGEGELHVVRKIKPSLTSCVPHRGKLRQRR
jgi:hypothetical protein